MKNNYENRAKTYLTRRLPVIVRLDMRAGHTFTRGLKKPFDEIFVKSMQATMKHLCENIQGCVLGYTQSDEITLVLVDYQTLTTDAWFDYSVQKVCSISASMATIAFNRTFVQECYKATTNFYDAWNTTKEEKKYIDVINQKPWTATFDSRCFSIPKEEVCNCLIWRQQDATRNSIQSVGQAHFSHKELNEKTCENIQDMLMTQKNINWNDFPTTLKRGSCCVKIDYQSEEVDIKDGVCARHKWIIDNDIPIFTQNRKYVECRIYFKGDNT